MVDTSALGEERSQFLSDRMNPLLHDMVTDLICHQPKEPMVFISNWLQRRLGRPSDFEIDVSRLKTVAKDSQVEALKIENAELTRRLDHAASRLREGTSFLRGRAEGGASASASQEDAAPAVDGTAAAVDGEAAAAPAVEGEVSEEEDDETDLVDEIEPRVRPRGLAVSAEGDNKTFHPRGIFSPPVHLKGDETRERLAEIMEQSFLLSACDVEAKEAILNALEEEQAGEGDKVIQQGDSGDFLYIVESGTLECYLNHGEEDEAMVKTVEPGMIFGEQTLLHNQRRAVSVVCKEPCMLWRLDRETYSSIVKQSAATERRQRQKLLSQIPMFASLTKQEQSRLCDGLVEVAFEEGAQVVTQGDEDDIFYVVKKGTLVVIKDGVQEFIYTTGDFFGDLALIFDQPRPTTLKVTAQQCELYALSRSALERLLGPMVDKLSRKLYP
ncbi:unnamed protein product [Amoebophrya sp. A25]|nr:unnamed protein product [Amoebophrya sp. A25]|eukprot:GSA25T00005596001.1